MNYTFMIVQRNHFVTNTQYQEALETIIEDENEEWYIVSLDDYDEDFSVFAKEL